MSNIIGVKVLQHSIMSKNLGKPILVHSYQNPKQLPKDGHWPNMSEVVVTFELHLQNYILFYSFGSKCVWVLYIHTIFLLFSFIQDKSIIQRKYKLLKWLPTWTLNTKPSCTFQSSTNVIYKRDRSIFSLDHSVMLVNVKLELGHINDSAVNSLDFYYGHILGLDVI